MNTHPLDNFEAIVQAGIDSGAWKAIKVRADASSAYAQLETPDGCPWALAWSSYTKRIEGRVGTVQPWERAQPVSTSDVLRYGQEGASSISLDALKEPAKAVKDIARRLIEANREVAAKVRDEAANRLRMRGELLAVAADLKAQGWSCTLEEGAYWKGRAYRTGGGTVEFDPTGRVTLDRVSLHKDRLPALLALLAD